MKQLTYYKIRNYLKLHKQIMCENLKIVNINLSISQFYYYDTTIKLNFCYNDKTATVMGREISTI